MKLDIKELHEKYDSLMGKEIELNGWIKSNRDQSSLGFIDLNDGTSFKGVLWRRVIHMYKKMVF